MAARDKDCLDKRLHAWRDDVAAAHLRGKVEATRFVDGTAYIVQAVCLDVRRQPDAMAGLDTQLLYGERFIVYEEKDGWAWGQAATDDYVGYVPMAGLTSLSYETNKIITAPHSFIYHAPDVKAPLYMALSMGCHIQQIDEPEQGQKFTRVACINEDEMSGQDVWMVADELAAPHIFADDFVGVAELYLNAPYLWGGRTARGLDCSALVQLALQRAGQNCPRDADMQESLGTDIKEAIKNNETKLQRGDLIFWRGHVGIMQSADLFLHANATYMKVTSEDFASASQRIAQTEGEIIAVRRL